MKLLALSANDHQTAFSVLNNRRKRASFATCGPTAPKRLPSVEMDQLVSVRLSLLSFPVPYLRIDRIGCGGRDFPIAYSSPDKARIGRTEKHHRHELFRTGR